MRSHDGADHYAAAAAVINFLATTSVSASPRARARPPVAPVGGDDHQCEPLAGIASHWLAIINTIPLALVLAALFERLVERPGMQFACRTGRIFARRSAVVPVGATV